MPLAVNFGRHGESPKSFNLENDVLITTRSEELGRWPTQQLSLFLVNIWQISSALSPTFGGLLTSRILGGLSTAGVSSSKTDAYCYLLISFSGFRHLGRNCRFVSL